MSKRHNNKRTQQSDESTVGNVDRLLQEINLLNLERYLFSTDRKRPTKPHTTLTFTDSEGKDCTLEIGRFGRPGELSYRVLHAILHQIVENGRTCIGDVCLYSGEATLSKRQLARLCGRSWSGGADDADYHRAIMALHTTRVEMAWYEKSINQTKTESFHPFANADFVTGGDVRRNPSALKAFDSCTITVNNKILESYNTGYFRAFNMARLLPLQCNGQMLYKRLFLVFGYLHRKGIAHPRYEKDYEPISIEWLNQTPRRYLSDIKRHLGAHLDGLVSVGLLRRYEIVRKVNGQGYKIAFIPGGGFYEDYPLYLETTAAHLPMRAPDVREYEATELLSYFDTKRGHARARSQFRPKELQQARDHLKTYSVEEGKDLIDFSLDRKAMNVEPQVFGFVLGYLPEWSQEKEERMRRRLWREKIAGCAYCNDQGFLEYIDGSASKVHVCPHNREKIERWAQHHGFLVPVLRDERKS